MGYFGIFFTDRHGDCVKNESARTKKTTVGCAKRLFRVKTHPKTKKYKREKSKNIILDSSNCDRKSQHCFKI